MVKIYKIIDFGRATFKYKGKDFCSDSYHLKGGCCYSI